MCIRDRIADSCGFCTVSLFSRVFKKFFGLKPSQFRTTERPVYAQDGILFSKNGQMVSKNLTPKHVLSPQLCSCLLYTSTSLNPLRDILTDYNRVRMTRMCSTGYAAIEPIKGLKLKETLSYDYTIQKLSLIHI